MTPRRFLSALTVSVFVLLAVQQAYALISNGLGSDATIYYRAATAWTDGSDPWAAFDSYAGNTYHFYAAPTAAMLLAPFTLLPESAFVPLWIFVQAICAVFAVRRLSLPTWWLFFPPVWTGVLSGNPSLAVLALLVAAHPVSNAVAVLIKIYAVVPLIGEGRVRSLMTATVLTLGSVAVAPSLWDTFISDAGRRNSQLLVEAQGGFSGFRDPVLFGIGLAAIGTLLVLDRRRAAWLAPIALWPASQFHWSTLAMPVMTPILALGLAFPVHGLPPLVVALDAWRLAWKRVRQGTGSPEHG